MSRIGVFGFGLFVIGFDTYLVAGLLPAIGNSLGTAASAVGQGVTVYTVCYGLSAPLLAVFFARMPARVLLMIAIGVFALGNVLTAMSPGLPVFLAGRAVAGVGAGCFTPVVFTAVNVLAPPGKRGRAIGTLLALQSVGAAAGTPLSVPVSAVLGWRGVFVVLAVLGLVCLAGVRLWPPVATVPAPPSLRSRLALLADRRVLALAGVTVLTAAASLGLYTYVSPMAAAVGTAASVPVLLAAWGIGGLAGGFSIGPLFDRVGRPATLLAAVLVALATAILVVRAALPAPAAAAVAFFAWGMAGWAVTVPQQALLIRERPDHVTMVVALNGSALLLGSALGTSLHGALLVRLPATALPIVSAGLLSLALLGHLVLSMRFAHRAEPVRTGEP